MDKYMSNDTQLMTKNKHIKDMEPLDVIICPTNQFDLGNTLKYYIMKLYLHWYNCAEFPLHVRISTIDYKSLYKLKCFIRDGG